MISAWMLSPAFCVGAIIGMWWMRQCYRPAMQRIHREIQEIIQKGDEVIAESKARLPYDGEVQLPDEVDEHTIRTTERSTIAS